MNNDNSIDISLSPIFFPLFDERFEQADTWFLYGGRDTGKSVSLAIREMASALQREAAGETGRIIAARSAQVNLNDSMMAELKRIADIYPKLGAKFNIGQQYIRTRLGMVSFAFVGTNTNPISLKGITNAFLGCVDEADAMTEDAIAYFLPTLRAKNAKAIFSFNPSTENTPLAKMFLKMLDGANGCDADANLYKSFIDPVKRLGVIFGDYADNPYLSTASARRILAAQHGDMDEDDFNCIYRGHFRVFTKDAYYSKCLRECEAEHRIDNFVVDYSLPIYTCWDLGINDLMTVVVWQPVWDYDLQKFKIFVIDYFGGNGYPVDYYAELLQSNGYGNCRCFLPHDACVDPATLIRMADGSVKAIKDIQVGEYVMGYNSIPRRVKDKHFGIDKMFKIKGRGGIEYKANSKHLNVLKNKNSDDFEFYTAPFIIGQKKWFHEKKELVLNSVNMPERDLLVDPYYLGLWLGDGTRRGGNVITTPDIEIIEWLIGFAKRNDVGLNAVLDKRSKDCLQINFPCGRGKQYNGNITALMRGVLPFSLDKKGMTVFDKRIPDIYIRASREQRLQLLAGLIDTDGNLAADQSGYFITTVFPKLANDIKNLCGSLGLRITSYKISSAKHIFKEKKYLCQSEIMLRITGNISIIPCKVKRKQVFRNSFFKNSFTVQYLGMGKYCGIELEGDPLYYLANGILTHNSRKSYTNLYSAQDALSEAGFKTTIIPNQGAGAAFNRIVKTRGIFSRIYLTRPGFNARMQPLFEALQKYAPKIVNNLPTDTPDHTYSDPCDAFGMLPYALETLRQPVNDTPRSRFDKMQEIQENRQDYWGAGL